MKKIFFAIAVISLVFLTSACKKDSSGNTIYPMSASIDGKQWTAAVPAGILYSANGVFVITGISLSGETIIVTINGQTTGTYNLSLLPPKSECVGTYKATLTPSSTDTYVSVTSAKVVLTKVDKTKNLISGTFEFTGVNSSAATKQITSGAFNDVTFITQ